MKIQVTREDIINGTKNEPCYCPIARAIKRTLKLTVGVAVFPVGDESLIDGQVAINGKYYWLEDYPNYFANCYDRGVEIDILNYKPFEFELDYVDYRNARRH